MLIGHDSVPSDQTLLLEQPIEKCLSISPNRLSMLRRLGVYRAYDLVSLFPKDYEDWTKRSVIAELRDKEDCSFCAIVRQKPSIFRKGRLSVIQTVLADETGVIKAVWFNQPYYRTKLEVGTTYLFRGKIKRDGKSFEVINPNFREEGTDEIPGIRPIYPMTKGLTQNNVRAWVERVLPEILSELPEPIPVSVRKSEHLCSASYAYEKIHLPQDSSEIEEARKRLIFEELFMIIGGLKAIKRQKASDGNAKSICPDRAAKESLKRFIRSFPFKLTEDQERVFLEISMDLSSNRPMNRLVQGDVGSGKTAVAAAAMCLCAVCGHQSIFMAPTSVLSYQHYMNLKDLFEIVGIRSDLMLGSTSVAEKRQIRARLKSGETKVLIGTHAVLSEKNEYNSLALLITDEQHRFGVRQRGALSADSAEDLHTLVMSATPIPRTLAMILYGDLDISVIRSVPSGRMPIETYLANSAEDSRVYEIMKRQMKAGRQVYYVCPQIESDEESEGIASVTEQYELFRNSVFPSCRVALLHGGMPSDHKDTVMRDFSEGNVDLLVTTTVIEVGVDNANASLMVIENAERFGLATLHQLRGRIGRGPHRSVCILKSDSEDELATKRLKTVCSTTDGFVLAEKDLELRGPGDFFGTRQHGLPALRIANLYRDAGLLERISEMVDRIFDKDGGFTSGESARLFDAFTRRFGREMDNPPL